MWIVFGGLFFLYGIGRRFVPARRALPDARRGEESMQRQSFVHRASTATSAAVRRYLLPEAPLRSIFGRTTRLQVAILAFLIGYLTLFTFVGYRYEMWVTPVKASPGSYNTRTSLGPWSDRVGVMAYAIIPFSVMLATRESLLSLITGVPYQNFMFIHRWMGYIIYVQSVLHTIGWTVIEAKLYQPQPKVWNTWIAQTYAIWGVVAMALVTLILGFSLPPVIRWTGYEVFRKMHYIMAMLFIGACYGHWKNLGVFMIAALIVWFVDRFFRLARTFVMHYDFLPESTSAMHFQAANAKLTHFPDAVNGDVVRMDFLHNHSPWAVGQHFYLCFPESSMWQSHPFTPLSLPGLTKGGQQHSYVFRAKGGETKRIADIALKKIADVMSGASSEKTDEISARQPLTADSVRPTAKVILTGPYGANHVDELDRSPGFNVLLIAGGTGITFVLPVLFHLMTAPTPRGAANRKLELVWAIRRHEDVAWVQSELDTLRAASKRMGLVIRVFVTRESDAHGAVATVTNEEKIPETGVQTVSCCDDSCSNTGSREGKSGQPKRFTEAALNARPSVSSLVASFVKGTVSGPTVVYTSGPPSMITDVRRSVATQNSVRRIFSGDERARVEIVADDRIE